MEGEIGFKEWTVVCDALASGRQTVILRKGGIHEGKNGFGFLHSQFYLFPTRFHVSAEQIREGAVGSMPEWQAGDLVQITHSVNVTEVRTLIDWEEVAAFAPQHIYTEKTVRDRFDWDFKGNGAQSIHVASVEVGKLESPWLFPYLASYGGCRSWVTLPAAPEHARIPRI